MKLPPQLCSMLRARSVRWLALGSALLVALPDPAAAQGGKPRVREPAEPIVRSRPAPAPSQPLPPGKYRVSVVGFTVNHQTDDDMLQLDGKGDEVFLSVVVLVPREVGGDLNFWQGGSRLIESEVIGDRNGFPSRIRAGSLSDQGGLKTGDVVRLPQPVELWEGPLSGPIVVIPTIWEWDNRLDRQEIHRAWVERMRPPDGRALKQWGSPYSRPEGFDYHVVKARGFQELTKHPCVGCYIGTFDARAYGIFEDPMSGYNRPIAINMSSGFRPATISLSTRNLEPFLGAKNSAEFPVQYKDNGKGSGDYTIHLKFERIP